MKKEILLLLICFVLIALVVNIQLKQNEVFVIKNGEYISIMDADLQQRPKYILDMVNFLEKLLKQRVKPRLR